MDPNAAYANFRTALSAYQAAQDADNGAAMAAASVDLAEASDALDTWLSRGGSLPKAWMHAREADLTV